MLIGIFGAGRNGSSLIGRLLDGLEDTYVHPVEEKFLTGLPDLVRNGRVSRMVEQNCVNWPIGKELKDVDIQRVAGYFNRNSLNDIHKHCQASIGLPSQLPAPTLSTLLGDGVLDVEAFTREYLASIARFVRPDVQFQHYLFKSIETPYIEEYEQRFPDMRFIHILRDPVPMCSSQKRSLLENKALPASYLGFDWLNCMLDKRWVPHAKFISDKQNDPKHLVVRYEDLVKNPEQEIESICERLNLAAPKRPNVQTVFHDLDKSRWGGNPSKKGVETPKKVVANLQSGLDYDEVLTQREIDLIGLKTKEYLPMLGYELLSHATHADIVRAYLMLDKWEFMHWRSPRLALRGMIGLIYRRMRLF